MAEMMASSAYDTSTVAEGRESSQTLRSMASISLDGDDNGELCCSVPGEVFEEGGAPDTTMFGTTSLHSFAQLVDKVDIDCVVKVLYKHKPDRKVGHLVVIGPNGFQLCTCLQLLRRGMQCRHVLAALVTHLKRGVEFKGESIHPRWRLSMKRWSLETAGLGMFEGHGGSESYDGGFTCDGGGAGDFQDLPSEVASDRIAVVRGRAYANIMEVLGRAARLFTDNMTTDFRPSDQAMFGRLVADVEAHVKRNHGGSTEGFSGVRDPPIYVTKNRKQTRHKDALEGGKSKKPKTGGE